MERHLAAVLIADVVGYGRLSSIDEEGTRERFQADLKQIFEPGFAVHHGRLIKTMGDGMLVEFPSVVDAVRCAVALQHQKADRNAVVLPDQRLEFRIGINLGDIIVEDDDIQGDGVNIADRLQALAEPGGIAISGTAYDHVRAKLPVGFASLGEQRVKNIAEPVRVYRVMFDPAAAGKTIDRSDKRRWAIPATAAIVAVVVLGLVAAWWQPGKPPTQDSVPAAAAAIDTRPSLVVLPFDNLSDDKQQEYLANGFTEDLTTELARIPGLFVVSRNAAFAYKDQDTKPAEIASALGVRYLLEGSVRRVGDEMRINAQLIDGSNSGHLWAERFDGNWTEVFALQDKVVGSIAGALKLRLVGGAQDSGGGTDNPAAYDAYLKGMDIYNRPNTPEEFAQSVSYLEQALRLDPDFGAAAACLAWTYWDATEPRAKALGLSGDEVYAKLFQSLETAAKHPSSPYYQLVADLLVREHRSDEAIALLLKAVALNPSDPWNYIGLAIALNFNGQPREALDYLDAAQRVDPNPGWMDFRNYQTGLAYFGQGRFEEAVGILEKVNMQSPDPWGKFYAVQVLVSAYAHLGRNDRIAIFMDQFKRQLADRKDQEPNLLLTQQFFVFKTEADMVRLLAGLSKAGVPDLPPGVNLDSKDRLTGEEIKSLVFGHELRGRKIAPDTELYERTTSTDGSLRVTFGSTTLKGRSWVQGNFLCNAYPKELTGCGAIFRNMPGTPERQNEYIAVYRWNQFEFSVVR